MFICDYAPGRRFFFRAASFAGWIAFVLPLIAATSGDRHPPLTPEQALARFQLEPGLRIELVAAEPLVVDPVAFVFDEHQRLFVVEGRGYPDPVEGGGTTTAGRVVMLEDSNGDGRYDRRKEFATGLGYVNGITAWRGGFFVTAAPDLLYLKDNDGDGIADERRVVLTGFEATKTAQIRVSHPTLGFDGNIYVTSGLNGGNVTSPLYPERPAVSFSPRDGRFNPDTFEFENTGGRAQFGLVFDPFGRRFISTNRHPVLQVMLEPWHLARNPHLAFSEFTQEVSKVEAEAKVFPISGAAISADYIPKLMAAPHTGTFTSACGLLVFNGTGLTPDHRGNVFICEPAQNLIQRQTMRPDGASFRAERVPTEKEFLASTDVWFRPVFLGHGPDGALYIADMNRREIDHPRYVPEESRGGLDFESGKDRGRIYRIVRDGAPVRPVLGLVKSGDPLAELIAGLESPDEWWRERAQRRLLERGERAAVPALQTLVVSSKQPEARVRALALLRELDGLTADTLKTALRDPHPGVREIALQSAGEVIGRFPELLAPVVVTAGDEDARVRLTSALVLGSLEDAQVVPALAAIAVRDGEDRWARAAVLSGIGSRMAEFLASVQAAGAQNPKAYAAVMEHLGRVFGAGATPAACRDFLAQMLSGNGELSWRMPSVLGLIEGFRGRAGNRAAASQEPFKALLGDEGRQDPRLQAFFRLAAERATDEQASTAERVTAVSLLGYSDYNFASPALGKLLDARQPPGLQLQAVRALERLGDPRGGTLLIAKENWTRYTPQVREAVIATLTSKSQLIDVLFGAIRAGVVAAPEISSVRRTQLMKHANADVKKNAEEIFKDLEGGDRMQVYRTYRETLALNTEIARGKDAYVRACSACHTFRGAGGKVGPDLTGIRNQPADAILLHILVPNYEVAPNYQTLSLTTHDGRSATGWLAGETESSLTLRTAFGTEETILRKNIATITASGVSLMPDGLEQTMAKEDLSALVAYLKSGD